MMLRTVLAAIAGYVLIGVLVVFTDQLLSSMQGFNAAAAPAGTIFKIRLGTDAFYSILGGFLCATIARAAAKKSTLYLMIGGELIGLAATIPLWKSQPHWFAIGLLILYPPAVWVGSWFGSRRQPAVAGDLAKPTAP
jgi:hypothetical protein